MSQDLQESAALAKLHESFSEAFRDNDFDKLGAFYTETAVFLPPGRPVVTGRSAILGYWQDAQRILDLKFETTAAQAIADDVLREIGTLTVKMRGEGRETRVKAMKYLLLWQKSDGKWQITTTAWSALGGGRKGAGKRGVGKRGAGRRRRGGAGPGRRPRGDETEA